MALYRIDVGDGTDTNTVLPDVGWRFNKNLNQVNEAEFKFSGTGEARRSLLAIGSSVTIYKDGTIAFIGLIDNTDYFVGGTVMFHASGWEVWLAKEPGVYSNSPWTSTASATIFSEIIAESTKLSAGTINAGYSMDYRLTTSQSLWNAISNLANKTSQDVSIDYTASPVEISIFDHTGSATSVAVLNEGKEITNVRKSEGYPRGNIIKVFGKGDGDDQITGTAQDATSIAAYGSITKSVIDRSIMTTAEANRLAAAELALNKDPPQIYDFDLTNPDYTSLSLGDIITLNALDQDVSNEEVRIVGIEEGMINGEQYITLQTTNPELKTLMKTKNKIMAQLQKTQEDSQTYMQGSGNLSQWGGRINGNNSAGLKVQFYVGSRFQDEAGTLKIDSLTVDYDVDPYLKEVGTASFDGSDPQVNNSSAVTNPDVEGSSATQTPTANSGSLSYAGSTGGNSSGTGDQSKVSTYETLYGSPSFQIGRGQVCCYNNTGSSYNVNLSVTTNAGFSGTEGNQSLAAGYTRSYETGSGTRASWVSTWVKFFDGNNNANFEWGTCNLVYSHTHGSHSHGPGGYKAESHLHSPGGYDISSSDLDDISIGDSVSEAGSLNASGINIYLDFWNTGTSNWDNKHSVTNTGKTLDTEVDVTNSGTYPDAAGFWRIRILTNNASPDLIQSIVNIKHHMDN